MSIDWNKRMRNVWKAKKVQPICVARGRRGLWLRLSIQRKHATNFQRIKSTRMQIHAHSLMLSSICRYIIGVYWKRGGGGVALRHELFSRQLDSPKCISNVCAAQRDKKCKWNLLSVTLPHPLPLSVSPCSNCVSTSGIKKITWRTLISC